jgi:hypothetical protein
MKKTKITFAIPEILQKELRLKVTEEGYGFRGKSKWVTEAIDHLLSLDNYPMLVQYSEEMNGFDKMDTIVITLEARERMNNALLQIRKQYPALEGVQSAIVRTAIMQRLLRS